MAVMTINSKKRPRTKRTLVERLNAYQRKLISTALRKHKGSPKLAARELGVDRPGLYRRMDRLGIELDDFRSRG